MVAIRSAHNSYLAEDPSTGAVCLSTTPFEFQLVQCGHGKVAFRTPNGKYLCALDDRKSFTFQPHLLFWEMFTVGRFRTEELGWRIRTHHGTYLGSIGDSPCQQEQPYDWEHWAMPGAWLPGSTDVALRAGNGMYLAEDGGNPGLSPTPFQFQLVKCGQDKCGLKTPSGKYLCALDNRTSFVFMPHCLPWEMYAIKRSRQGDQGWSVFTQHETYVGVNASGLCQQAAAGDDEHWEVLGPASVNELDVSCVPPPPHHVPAHTSPAGCKPEVLMFCAPQAAGQDPMLLAVNLERQRHGACPLRIDLGVMAAAMLHSAYMHESGNFSHTGRGGSCFCDRLTAEGVTYGPAGENICMGRSSVAEVVRAWMNSPGHRKNLLNPSFARLGWGHVGGYWTQVFNC